MMNLEFWRGVWRTQLIYWRTREESLLLVFILSKTGLLKTFSDKSQVIVYVLTYFAHVIIKKS